MEIRVQRESSDAVLAVRLEAGERLLTARESLVLLRGDVHSLPLADPALAGRSLGLAARVAQAIAANWIGNAQPLRPLFEAYSAGVEGGEVWLAPNWPGELVRLRAGDVPVHMRGTAFLAARQAMIHLEDGAFLGERPQSWLRADSADEIWLGGIGGVAEIEAAGELAVDALRLIAFAGEFATEKRNDALTVLRGRGRVWLQAQSETGLARELQARWPAAGGS